MLIRLKAHDVDFWHWYWCLAPRVLKFKDDDTYFVFFEKILRRRKTDTPFNAIHWEYKRAPAD